MRRFLLALPFMMGLPKPTAAVDEIGARIADAGRAGANERCSGGRIDSQRRSDTFREKTALDLGERLPPPLPGWTVQQSIATLNCFDGITLSRHYKGPMGLSVLMMVTWDSPKMRLLEEAFGMPAMDGSDGTRVVRLPNFDVTVNDMDEVTIRIDSGSSIFFPGIARLEDKLAYAAAIDLTRLAQRP